MPLHVGENHDKGGNTLQVRWFDRGSNLHRVWDSGIVDRAGRGEEGWLADLVALDTDAARSQAQAGTWRIGPRNPCWPPVRPTSTPPQASGSSRAPSWERLTRRGTCRW
jgi:hypothetical protein